MIFLGPWKMYLKLRRRSAPDLSLPSSILGAGEPPALGSSLGTPRRGQGGVPEDEALWTMRGSVIVDHHHLLHTFTAASTSSKIYLRMESRHGMGSRYEMSACTNDHHLTMLHVHVPVFPILIFFLLFLTSKPVNCHLAREADLRRL